MPSSHPPSQPDGDLPAWLQRPAGRQMLADVQRMATPELTRIYGQHGIYLRPAAAIAGDLSGNMVANVMALHRRGSMLDGRVRCQDDQLPFGPSSLSLVYALFILETSPRPGELMQEIARCLKPEGVLLLIGFNPWSPARLPGGWGVTVRSGAADERLAKVAGLELLRCQHLGPFWPSEAAMHSGAHRQGWLDRLRVARLLVLRRREAALTPLRKASPAVSLRPGMSAG